MVAVNVFIVHIYKIPENIAITLIKRVFSCCSWRALEKATQ